VADLLAKMDQIFNATDKDDKQKNEELYKFYVDEVHEELKAAYKAEVQLRMKGEFAHFKNGNFYDEQQRRAQLVLNKYEVLTREYQTQNKNLKDNHERIIAAEQSKRQEIISNFEAHLT
jgi:Myosin-like coiled-coil protein